MDKYYVREDGAADFTADDRVRWNLTPRQREICQAAMRLEVGDIEVAMRTLSPDHRGECLALVKAEIYRRLHCVLGGAANSTGYRWYESTDAQREEMRSLGLFTGRPRPLYFDEGEFFSHYIDAVIAASGASEEEVWDAVGLLPPAKFAGDTPARLKRPRTRAAARNRT